jgi:hypothetical protein
MTMPKYWSRNHLGVPIDGNDVARVAFVNAWQCTVTWWR